MSKDQHVLSVHGELAMIRNLAGYINQELYPADHQQNPVAEYEACSIGSDTIRNATTIYRLRLKIPYTDHASWLSAFCYGYQAAWENWKKYLER